MKTTTFNDVGILDCTFRDGGYYTNWEFPDQMVNDYLATMASLPVDVIELGFSGKGADAGVFANVDNVLARSLRLQKETQIAVMLDAKDFLQYETTLDARLDATLGIKLEDGIDIIRIAVNYRNIEGCIPLVKNLQVRGYQVFLNLMQIDTASENELKDSLQMVAKIDDLTAVYVADSLGSMRPDRVKRIVARFQDALDTPIGYHAHDNSGLAIANALCAVEAGCFWIDCTVAGMGRGAGNASTEQLLPVAAVANYTEQAEFQLQRLVVEHFNQLKIEHGWGDSLFYHLGVSIGLHPTYVQEVLGNKALTPSQMFDWIKRIPPNSYSFDRGILDSSHHVVSNASLLSGAMVESIKPEHAA